MLKSTPLAIKLHRKSYKIMLDICCSDIHDEKYQLDASLILVGF